MGAYTLPRLYHVIVADLPTSFSRPVHVSPSQVVVSHTSFHIFANAMCYDLPSIGRITDHNFVMLMFQGRHISDPQHLVRVAGLATV